jgi:hypothetical protein
MPTAIADDVIELRVDEIAQLFHTLDPFPFRERDLDKEAEDLLSVGLENCRPIGRSKSPFTFQRPTHRKRQRKTSTKH